MSAKLKHAGGRPKKEVNWRAIDAMCLYHCKQTEIASFLNLSTSTLNRACLTDHKISFDEYLTKKHEAGNVKLRHRQWIEAEKGNVTMLIWLGKQYLNQKDQSSSTHSGPDGGPIPLDLNGMDEVIKQLVPLTKP